MSVEAIGPPRTREDLRPLCVDLDGTLVKSDTLHDSLLVLARTRPSRLAALPAKVLKGKAAFKAFVAGEVSLDVKHLPYNRKLLHYLQSEHAKGRKIYLTTGADVRLAQRIADHTGIFSGVLASDGHTNLTGKAKLELLSGEFGAGFDYIGNDIPDLTLLAASAEPMIANPTLRLRMRMRHRGLSPARAFSERAHPASALFKAVRVHQWAKNSLIFLPLLLSHSLTLPRFFLALLAFACFSFAASALYVFNDLLDIEADRRHAIKQRRPFAAGDLSAARGIGVIAIFLLLALSGIHALPATFYGWLLVYLATSLTYSSWLKRIAIVDVLVLSGCYTLRLLAGAAATRNPISHWLAGFSVFLFLSLALAKRSAELQKLRAAAATPHNGRGYLVADIDQLRSFGTSAASAAVVIFAIYISGSEVTPLYHKPERLWLVVPCMIWWLYRLWLLASRGELDEDPMVFAVTDRASLFIGAIVAVIVLLAI
ncbi:MAG: UbiA family prenyltransferase [Acidobacteriota bacterium]